MFESIEETSQSLARFGYWADESLATSVFLALRMERPLFLEGEPGTGKTELAKVTARALDRELIRLQCYEGLDLNHAVYEWNYPRQLLAIQGRRDVEESWEDIFSDEFLLRRPLLQAISGVRSAAPVLLIDELDRADEEFESFLLELLSDFQITIPEIGTLRAAQKPLVFLTSNRTREIHDALKRRCIFQWIDYPSFEKEVEILSSKVPGLEGELIRQVVTFVQALRGRDLYKLPGIAESLDWAESLLHLDVKDLRREVVESTLGFVLKNRDDVERFRESMIDEVLDAVG